MKEKQILLFLTESGNENVQQNMKGFSNVKVPQSPTFGNVFFYTFNHCSRYVVVGKGQMNHTVIMSCLIYG